MDQQSFAEWLAQRMRDARIKKSLRTGEGNLHVGIALLCAMAHNKVIPVEEPTEMFIIKFADPDTFEAKTVEVATVEEAQEFLETNWRIGFATVVPA